MPARLFRTVASFAAAAAFLGLTGIRSGTLAEPAPTLAIAPLASPAGAHSSEPQMTMEGDREHSFPTASYIGGDINSGIAAVTIACLYT